MVPVQNTTRIAYNDAGWGKFLVWDSRQKSVSRRIICDFGIH